MNSVGTVTVNNRGAMQMPFEVVLRVEKLELLEALVRSGKAVMVRPPKTILDERAWNKQCWDKQWGIAAKIRAQCPDRFAAWIASDDGISDVLRHIRAVWHEGVTDDEWFAAAVKQLEERLVL